MKVLRLRFHTNRLAVVLVYLVVIIAAVSATASQRCGFAAVFPTASQRCGFAAVFPTASQRCGFAARCEAGLCPAAASLFVFGLRPSFALTSGGVAVAAHSSSPTRNSELAATQRLISFLGEV